MQDRIEPCAPTSIDDFNANTKSLVNREQKGKHFLICVNGEITDLS